MAWRNWWNRCCTNHGRNLSKLCLMCIEGLRISVIKTKVFIQSAETPVGEWTCFRACVSLTENLTSKCKASSEHCAFTLHPTNVGNWMNVQQAQPASSLAFGSQALPPWRGASVAACKHLIRNPKTSKHSGFIMVHHYSSCTTRTQRPLIGYAAQRESSRTHHFQPNQTRNISMFVLAHRTSIV